MNYFSNSLAAALCFAFLIGCGSHDQQDADQSVTVPQLVLKDSLVIDYLGRLHLLDYKQDRSEYLLYDFQRSELVRVDGSGKIKQNVNRTLDGKDSYQSSYFTTANYLPDGDILIETYNQFYLYDGELNLKEKITSPYTLFTREMGGSKVTLPVGDFIYTFSIDRDQIEQLRDSDFGGDAYPYLTAFDWRNRKVAFRDSIPKMTQMIKNPGVYRSMDPIPLYHQNELYLLFPYSPEIYVYDFPQLKLTKTIDLEPGKNYQQTEPVKVQGNFDSFFAELASSTYHGFAFSNEYLLTFYLAPVPQEEVDALPRNVVGGPEYLAVRDKYKKNIYQIFRGDRKIWEGNWDISLAVLKNLIYSRHKEGEDPHDVERDEEVFYFFELK